MTCYCRFILVTLYAAALFSCRAKEKLQTETITIARAAAASTVTHENVALFDTQLTLTGSWQDISNENKSAVQATLTTRRAGTQLQGSTNTLEQTHDTIQSVRQYKKTYNKHEVKTQPNKTLFTYFSFMAVIVFGLIWYDIRLLSKKKSAD